MAPLPRLLGCIRWPATIGLYIRWPYVASRSIKESCCSPSRGAQLCQKVSLVNDGATRLAVFSWHGNWTHCLGPSRQSLIAKTKTLWWHYGRQQPACQRRNRPPASFPTSSPKSPACWATSRASAATRKPVPHGQVG